MHVLLVSSYYPRADDPSRGPYCEDQARALVRAGHRVGVIALPDLVVAPPAGPAVHWLRHGLDPRIELTEEHGLMVARCRASLPLRWRRSGARMTMMLAHRAYQRYRSARGEPALLHAHFCSHAGVAALAIAARSRQSVVLTEHHSGFLEGDLGLDPVERRQAQTILRGVDHRLAVSPALAEGLGRLGASQVEVLGNLVDPDAFPLGPDRRAAPDFRVAMIASLRPNKGARLLLDAFERAFGTGDARLVIAGEGPEREGLRRELLARGLEAQVSLPGHLPRTEIRALLQRCDVVVSASQRETFGIPLIEAMASGVPTIVTRSGGAPWVVESCGGQVVPRNDVEALADALRRARRARAHHDPLALRERCLARFGAATIVGRLEEIYRSL